MENNKTKKRILSSAESLFSKNGYNAVSMEDIAKEVSITKAALYYHFKSKESLFLEMIENEFIKFEEKIKAGIKEEGEPEERFRKFIVEYLNASMKNKNFIRIVIQKFSKKDKNLVDDMRVCKERMLDIVEPFVKDVFKDMNKKVDSRFATFMLFSVLNNVIAEGLIFGVNKWDVDYVADQIMYLTFLKDN